MTTLTQCVSDPYRRHVRLDVAFPSTVQWATNKAYLVTSYAGG